MSESKGKRQFFGGVEENKMNEIPKKMEKEKEEFKTDFDSGHSSLGGRGFQNRPCLFEI